MWPEAMRTLSLSLSFRVSPLIFLSPFIFLLIFKTARLPSLSEPRSPLPHLEIDCTIAVNRGNLRGREESRETWAFVESRAGKLGDACFFCDKPATLACNPAWIRFPKASEGRTNGRGSMFEMEFLHATHVLKRETVVHLAILINKTI